MQTTLQLRMTPTDAANASVLISAISQQLGRPSSQINGYQILKQSIDARSRQLEFGKLCTILVRKINYDNRQHIFKT